MPSKELLGYYCCKNWERMEDDFIRVYDEGGEFACEITALNGLRGAKDEDPKIALIKFCPWCGKRIREMPYSKLRPYPKDWICMYRVYDTRKKR